MNDRRRIRRALISVSDKSGIAEFARALEALGVEILSTGGTARLLASEGITVVEVSEYTGHAEIMAGRLKTLHPKIHGGLLGRRGIDDDTMDHHGIAPIDLVVVNLYPFRETIAQDDCDLATAVEHIDIGGPTMLRAAAKNYSDVTVVVDVNDYATILAELAHSEGRVAARTRFFLAGKAFEHTAAYDGAIAEYLGGFDADGERRAFAATHNRQFRKAQDMRYGENPHQAAAFYVEDRAPEPCVASARQQQGKALSYNNIADTDAALECVKQFEQPACVIVKHANPCGAATAATPLLAYERSFDCDPTSAFGGVIALNRPLDDATADAILGRQFVEVIIAPGASAEALSVAGRKRNIRVLTCDPWGVERNPGMDYKRVNGGLLVQERDAFTVTSSDLQIVTERAPDEREFADLHFAWLIAKFVKSNAIVYARDRQTIGIGAGQMSRVYSARIAAIKATDEGIELGGAVMASDAFFPFRDGIDAAAECGITAVIQPGGSVRDGDVIAAANEHGMAMIHTGMRHFRH